MNKSFTNTAKQAMLAFALLIFAAANSFGQAMSGTYTVCASGCDYSTVADAASALNTYGINGPVTIDIAAGTYTDNVTIADITGASSTNTITFKGSGMGSTILSGSGTQPFQLSGTKFLTIEDLSIENSSTSGTVYGIWGNNTENCTFRRCAIGAEYYHFRFWG